VHGVTVEQAHAGQRTALALHGVDRDQVTRGDWVVAPGSLHGSRFMDVRFELLSDPPREWKNNSRVRFHIGASEVIGRVVLLDHATLRPGESALAQLRLERPAVAARGDRFVVRAYSPARTVGGGTVIEPLAERRRRHGGGLESLAVHEKGSLAARLLERLDQEKKPVATATLAKAVGESETAVAAALGQLVAEAAAVRPVEGRWLGTARWVAARERIERDVRGYAERHPARYGVPKGELKRELKNLIEPALFDLAFDALVDDGAIEQRGEHVRPAGVPWEPPAETLAALRGLEAALEAEGLSVPDNASWQKSLGRQAAEVAALGFFLERLVRVNQELTCTSRQMEDVRAALAEHFTQHETIDMAGFKERFAISRKYSVPIAEHCDRVGWTVRVGDVRKPGGRL
jgi:selenocysteine-specific elongation factor